jgi:hypothetical protein
MGRQDYSVTSEGMSYGEALRGAIEDADREHGHEEGYSGAINSDDGGMQSKCLREPKPAKRCVVEQKTNKGARKWETVYTINSRWGGNHEGALVRTSQGDAMKKAKELAIKNNTTMIVTIKKRLVEGVSEIAEVSPGKSTEGKWKFWGLAMC